MILSFITLEYLKTNSGKKGEGMPVFRNPQYYFKEGFCWTDVNSTYLKARIKKNGVFDLLSMSMFTKLNIPDWYFVCMINSKLISLYVDNFVNNTSHFQINYARQLPIVIPTKVQLEKFEYFFNTAFKMEKLEFENELSKSEVIQKLTELQEDIDETVAILYDLV